MDEPKLIKGARALLFERLDNSESRSLTEAVSPFRVLNWKELKESVRRELVRLLNTRCSVPTHLLGAEERTVIDYGIPDFSSFSPHNADDRRRLAQIITQTVTVFEPRLREVRVTVEPVQQSHRSLWARIDGQLVLDAVTEPVSFPVHIHHKTGTAEVHESEST